MIKDKSLPSSLHPCFMPIVHLAYILPILMHKLDYSGTKHIQFMASIHVAPQMVSYCNLLASDEFSLQSNITITLGFVAALQCASLANCMALCDVGRLDIRPTTEQAATAILDYE